ncbi:DUF2341 domain-containing protein, partial [Candidatus Dojkabacteria bacterium]|nr:DUF2341 domain-containing protein [Candidatus Dojkabacteria bacterium]
MHKKLTHAIRIGSIVSLSAVAMFLGIQLKNDVEKLGNVLSASSPWIQTDWSGGQFIGLVTENVDTFSTSTNIETTVVNEISLIETDNWSMDYAQWQNRKKVLFDNTDTNLGVPSENLVDFPVLIKLDSGTDIDYSKTQNQGQDIRFTDSDGTILSYEIENWDESGSSFIWVKVPSIDINSSEDSIFLYYNNPLAPDAQNPADVWSNGYAMVQHLDDASVSTVVDSTSSNFTGTKRTSNA